MTPQEIQYVESLIDADIDFLRRQAEGPDVQSTKKSRQQRFKDYPRSYLIRRALENNYLTD